MAHYSSIAKSGVAPACSGASAQVTTLVYHDLAETSKAIRGELTDDCLLETRMVKANKFSGRWFCCNLLERQRRLFESLNTPMTVDTLLQHA